MNVPTLHCPCERSHEKMAFNYRAPPDGETRFDLSGQTYRRSYLCCRVCGHWYSDNVMDLSNLYGGAYVESTYGDNMRSTFERIICLPAEKSDNAGRVARVTEFATNHFAPGRTLHLLDIGSGLGVFPYRMKQAGWRCTALDPDPRAALHARDVVGVEAVTGDFFNTPADKVGRFEVVTFNKVLEHVVDPVTMLRRSVDFLVPDGFVYIEVPDVAAAAEGPGREEFFIEHLHVFSPTSLTMLAERSGFSVAVLERLQEPSSKYTLRAFMTPIPGEYRA